jgi:uncharacterized membrane protein YfcA
MNNKFTRGVVSFIYLLLLSFIAGIVSGMLDGAGGKLILVIVVIAWYATKKKVVGGIGLPYPEPPAPPVEPKA